MRELPKFNPGDIVSFCDDEAEVVRDFDTTVSVKQRNDDGGWDHMSWYKVFQGEPVKFVRAGEVENAQV
jgi:NMD protein affecting ribosome stability and mRNA decay